MHWSPPPYSPGQALMPDSVTAWGMQPCKQRQPPQHRTHPTPPILLIHELTSPNRASFASDKNNYFQNSQQGLRLHTLRRLGPEGRDAERGVRRGAALLQLAGFTITNPSSTLPSLCPPRCKGARGLGGARTTRRKDSWITHCTEGNTEAPERVRGLFACNYIVNL